MSYLIPQIGEHAIEDVVVKKLRNCRRLLVDDFMIRLPYCQDMLELVDKNKVSFLVNQSELTGILETSGLSLAEQAYIRRMRHQGRNNLAAKRLRSKKRDKEVNEELCLENLITERDQLEKEKRELIQEIEAYKNLLY